MTKKQINTLVQALKEIQYIADVDPKNPIKIQHIKKGYNLEDIQQIAEKALQAVSTKK